MQLEFWTKLLFSGLIAVSCSACSKPGEYREVTDADMSPVEDHEHMHTAPHDGILLELGAHEYSAEIVISDSDPKLALYIYDAHAENPVAAKADGTSLTVTQGEVVLKPVPQEGEAEGTASQFHIEGPLPKDVSYETIHGDLKVVIKDTPFASHVEPRGDNADHDHDHDGIEHANEDEPHTDVPPPVTTTTPAPTLTTTPMPAAGTSTP
ncbi:hypothetical protein [Rubinisphaera margarita]|uniref:hypothetical protein n=1 Tax=Rubinisphaera margarita TaxID=2909586 RepID=UPI001EE91448|nr:hypothetical protein [Rubinisphaera margarita]MCG6157170.1 hypothetical protein [Rubinisphaera margarita]